MHRTFALLALALPLAACGGGGSGGSVSSLAQAATKSTSTTSMRMDLTVTMTASQLSQPLTLTSSGVEDNSSRRAEMSIDMSKFAAAFGTVGKQLADPADWKGTEIADFGNGRALLYMNLPFLTKLVPGHKPWVKLDLKAYANKFGVDISQFTDFSSNPAEILDWLRATSGSIRKIGTETVEGVETTHYHATVDLSKYAKLVPPDQRVVVRKFITSLAGFHTFPVDAWVGNDGLVRKEHLAFTETVLGQKLTMNMVMYFHDFGGPVRIALPSAHQTVDVAKLAGRGTP